MSLSPRAWRGPALLAAVLLAGCSLTPTSQGPQRSPTEVRAELLRLLPTSVADRQGWAADIQSAFSAQRLDPSTENLCAVLAVVEQESTYRVDPPVPGLGRIAREEIDRRAARAYVPPLLVRAALNLQSPTGKTYVERLDGAHTERELSLIFEDFIAMVPLGGQLFGRFNPVRTGGPMQVSIEFAEAHARDYPYDRQGSIRHEVFSRRGGLYFGTAHLLGYPVDYPSPLYRFADFNAGWYASRNAAFQSAVSRAAGVKLALDGDLVVPGSRAMGETERAVNRLAPALGMSDIAIRHDLEAGASAEFAETDLYAKVYALAERKAGRTLPRAVLPGITLESPKITRNLTTAWFAQRVEERWQRCLSRAKG
ncbi:DUF1615 domain-containing protein [Pseudomonas oryzihabitans]|nr:DUF1615 domain-containing protein [Pseudomonas oryzihabitans]MDT3718629.1 DUF1615 domain-containing protein [Pseudomonas oryzihabitans]